MGCKVIFSPHLRISMAPFAKRLLLRGGLKLGRAKIDWLLGYLEQWMQKPVLNETGLTNRYDIRLKWQMSKPELEGSAAMPDPENICAAVRNQLGLGPSLERRSLPVVIVEKAE
jgi:uncharacterized protein (TIGR03435 family)